MRYHANLFDMMHVIELNAIASWYSSIT